MEFKPKAAPPCHTTTNSRVSQSCIFSHTSQLSYQEQEEGYSSVVSVTIPSPCSGECCSQDPSGSHTHSSSPPLLPPRLPYANLNLPGPLDSDSSQCKNGDLSAKMLVDHELKVENQSRFDIIVMYIYNWLTMVHPLMYVGIFTNSVYKCTTNI